MDLRESRECLYTEEADLCKLLPSLCRACPVRSLFYQWVGCRNYAKLICFPQSVSWWTQEDQLIFTSQEKFCFHAMGLLKVHYVIQQIQTKYKTKPIISPNPQCFHNCHERALNSKWICAMLMSLRWLGKLRLFRWNSLFRGKAASGLGEMLTI